ncbi:MAG: DUF4389 domain-containing protein [Proteobacteria bacterium]|nr:DUF4389 domain-containing protein [Pseudomonadota bacterium]
MNDTQTTEPHGKDESTWLRLVFLVLFAIIFNIAEVVLWLTVVVQFLAKAFGGKPIPQITKFGQNLATFLYDVVRFLTFRVDDMPWPFAPWPDGSPGETPDDGRRRRRTTQPVEGAAGE